MRRALLITALLATATHAAEFLRPADPAPPLAPLPQGWRPMGAGGPHRLPGRCELGLETETLADGPQLFSIRCANGDIPSFGGAYMSFAPARYQGKRVRVSGWVKVEGVDSVARAGLPTASGGASLWLAVGSPSDGTRTDRMQDRSITGTTAWEYRDFVVDVPTDSRQILVGFWLEGSGQVWVRDLQVEQVSRKEPLKFHEDDAPGSGLTLK